MTYTDDADERFLTAPCITQLHVQIRGGSGRVLRVGKAIPVLKPRPLSSCHPRLHLIQR